MPCVFTEMLKIRIVNAKTITAITKVKVLVAKPIIVKAMAFKPKPIAKGTRLLKRDTSQPDIGNPISDPIGNASNMVPKVASLKSNADLMVGILDAQVEKLNPDIKKKRLK